MVALVLVALTAIGCGGGGEGADSGSAARVGSDEDKVTATVEGRTIAGHCSGVEHDLPPVILDSGLGGGQTQLAGFEQQLSKQTKVCAYARAGVGESDPPATTPRPLADLVSDLDAFASASGVSTPFVLVGHSAGASVVFSYAQAHPEKVAGMVAMNPVPPASYLQAVRKVETSSEYQDEVSFYRGENEESVDFTSTADQLENLMPASVPYVVMFDEDCDGDAEFCRRIMPALTNVTASMADLGEGGLLVEVDGAGHEIFATQPETALEQVKTLLKGSD